MIGMKDPIDQDFMTDVLRDALQQNIPIGYRVGGSRAIEGESFLERAWTAARQIGITRVSQISELANFDYPVFQSTRPHTWAHHHMGVNSGSQGKGATPTQALLSCLMESIESYCMEPRDPLLIRGSLRFLSPMHQIVDPRLFVRADNCAIVQEDEPLLWSQAYCPTLDLTTLIPAELVYYPLPVSDFQTRSIFPRGFSGYAAGTSYLDAVIHGLYELIERKLTSLFEENQIQTLYQIRHETYAPLQQMARKLDSDHSIQLLFIQTSELKPIPVFACIVRSPTDTYVGWGCSYDFETAAERALSEAVQLYAAVVSASREDIWMAHRCDENPWLHDPVAQANPALFERSEAHQTRRHSLPSRQFYSVDYDKMKVRSGHQQFTTLQGEYQALQKWLNESGYPLFFISNLTPVQFDIPVVKIIVPQMALPRFYRYPRHFNQQHRIRLRYRNIQTEKKSP
jgi:ribosomal protein S12 methylthiotransferase accessory factor